MTAARWIYFSDCVLPEDVPPAALLGGKGISLRRLSAAGVTIPRGFTITTSACRATLNHNGEWPAGLAEELSSAVLRLSCETGRSIDDGLSPLRLAVRSGAESSMPGMLDTILDCDAALPELRQAVSSVFNSWHSERAIAWRQRHGMDEAAGTAVTVQEMLEPVSSGVLFTSAPDSASSGGRSNAGEMFVEAVAGRGDALVSGQATPCRFAIDRASLSVRLVESASAPTDAPLTESQIRELCEIGLRLEMEFGEPLDIEWGLTENGFVFFQARPMTAAASLTRDDFRIAERQIEDVRKAEVTRVAALLAESRALVRHNLSESLPAPTPMTWSIVRRMMSGSGGFGRLYRFLGYAPGRRVREDGFLQLVAGRIYADPDRIVSLLATEWPLGHDLALLRTNPERLDDTPRNFDPDQTHPLLLLLFPHLAWVVLRSSRRIRQLTGDAEQRFAQEVIPKWLDWVARERSRDLASATREELLAALEERIRRTVDEFAAESLLPGTLGAIALATLHRQLTSHCGAEAAAQFRASLLASIDSPLQQRQASLLRQLGTGEDVQSKFLAEFGHRGPEEMELSRPRWSEEPPQIAGAVSQPAQSQEPDNQTVKEDPVEQLRSLLSEAGVPRQADSLIDHLEVAQRLLPLREVGRHNLMLGFALIRDVLEELGRRLNIGNGIYFLEANELSLAASRQTKDLISRRKANRQLALQLSVPDFLDGESVEQIAFSLDREIDAAGVFDAEELAAGCCVGVVAKVDLSTAPRELPSNAILVAEAIDPGLTPLLLRSAGIIVARGGMLSHGAVIARQLGLPAVRSVAAAQALQDGQRVSIDTRIRTIRVIDDADA